MPSSPLLSKCFNDGAGTGMRNHQRCAGHLATNKTEHIDTTSHNYSAAAYLHILYFHGLIFQAWLEVKRPAITGQNFYQALLIVSFGKMGMTVSYGLVNSLHDEKV